MSERRHKRKDDTWTKDELTSALHKRDERRPRKERSRVIQDDVESAHGSSDSRRERRSSKRYNERTEHVNDDEEYMKRRSKRDEKEKRSRDEHRQNDPRRDKERRHKEREEDDDEYRREREKRRREKQRKEMENEKEARREKRRERKYEEEHFERRPDRERRHKERDERKQRSREYNGAEAMEGKHREKRDERRTRYAEAEDEQEIRRRERKEEKRRRREEEKKAEEREKRRHEKSRRSGLKQEFPRTEESTSVEEEIQSRKSEDRSSSRKTDDVVKEDYNYDDEEFEDYEDDFEEDAGSEVSVSVKGSEVDEVIQAIKKENERVASARTLSARSDRYDSASPAVDSSSSSQVMTTTVNFSAAKLRGAGSKTSRRILKRRDDLMNLIQLDVISFDMFDLPPVTEYNFYIKNFGSQNSRQISTQCNDDALEVETQTDLSDVVEKWTQHPQDGPVACGGSTSDSLSPHRSSILMSMQEGSQRFSSFLTYASNLVESSIAESVIWSDSKAGHRSILSCCDSCTKFNTNLSYLQGRQILHAVFGDGQIAVSFGMSDHKVATRIDKKGLITVWKPTNTDQPDKILMCDGLPNACCFVPQNKNLLFVGTDDGSVLVYDLTEPSTMHQSLEIEKNKISVLRNPTYTTGWLTDIHSSPIVCVNPVGTFHNSNQIFSLEEEATICVWIVVEILSDVDDDVGLVPQGHIKLVKSTSFDVASSKSSGLGCRTTCAVCPDSNLFYVGTESGLVMSMTRDRKLKCFRSHSVGAVTTISVSKLNSSLMLVSYDDGTLSLFQAKQESPVMSWSLDGCVTFCDWSNCRSSVFFAMDSTNHLHVWDFMAMDSAPVVSDLFENKTRHCCVDKTTSSTTDLMVAYDSCAFEIHRISPHFTNSMAPDESEQMMSLVMSFG